MEAVPAVFVKAARHFGRGSSLLAAPRSPKLSCVRHTARFVCIGRALAHGRTRAPGFEDPTAAARLPDEAQRYVERIRSGEAGARRDCVSRNAVAGSRLIVVYHRPALSLKVIGLFVQRLGEPFRSSFPPEAMRALLARYGCDVTADSAICDLGAAISAAMGKATKHVKQLRVATADKRG
jgi:hypothetical protein